MVTIVNQILATLTIFSHIFLILGIGYFLLFRKDKTNSVIQFFSRNGIALAFFVSLFATAISLFYSDVAGFEPCKLCWFQRIFMYPQMFILGLAWFRKDHKIIDYALTLAVVGGLFALYHNYIYYGGTSLFPCDAFGLGVSCTKRYVFEFGYITIPLMSLTSFLLLSVFLWLQKFIIKNSLKKEEKI